MLATAAKLSRALAATLDVVLSELALEVQFRSFASDYSVPTSGFGWNLGGRILADRISQRHKQLIQCVSGPHVHSAALFYCGKWRSLEPARPSNSFLLDDRTSTWY